jgi:hypothetical protein
LPRATRARPFRLMSATEPAALTRDDTHGAQSVASPPRTVGHDLVSTRFSAITKAA